MGRAFKELGFRREDLVVSTKIFRCGKGQNDSMLSRKHIIEGLRNSLKRLQLDYVDVVFCHRPDYDTPLEETCRAMSWCIDQGMAFYWGTSEWPAQRIAEAIGVCEKLNLHKPVCEQPQYSMLVRERFEKEYKHVFEQYGHGTTIWSPLGMGLLSGKYNDGSIPDGSRFQENQGMKGFYNRFFGDGKKEGTIKMMQGLEEIAKEYGVTQPQLCLAWTLANKDVSTALLGFTRVEQVEENMKAVSLYNRWSQEIEDKIEKVLNNCPVPETNWKTFGDGVGRRQAALKK